MSICGSTPSLLGLWAFLLPWQRKDLQQWPPEAWYFPSPPSSLSKASFMVVDLDEYPIPPQRGMGRLLLDTGNAYCGLLDFFSILNCMLQETQGFFSICSMSGNTTPPHYGQLPKTPLVYVTRNVWLQGIVDPGHFYLFIYFCKYKLGQ